MSNSVCLIIPVRLKSERLPDKALALYNGRTLLQSSIIIAKRLDFVDKIVVAMADDDDRLKDICNKNNIEYVISYKKASCGTERAYFASKTKECKGFLYYITLPVDEPSIKAYELNKVWKKKKNHSSDKIYTMYSDFFCEEDVLDERSCKIVSKGKKVLYTSRAVIPSSKNGIMHHISVFKRHVAVFVFPSAMLQKYGEKIWSHDNNATWESLEQNSMIPFDLTLCKIEHDGFGIDTPDQIKLLEERMNK